MQIFFWLIDVKMQQTLFFSAVNAIEFSGFECEYLSSDPLIDPLNFDSPESHTNSDESGSDEHDRHYGVVSRKEDEDPDKDIFM